MTHDITHCTGIGCTIKEGCYRYQAHLEVANGIYKSSRISYFMDGYLCEKAKNVKEDKR